MKLINQLESGQSATTGRKMSRRSALGAAALAGFSFSLAGGLSSARAGQDRPGATRAAIEGNAIKAMVSRILAEQPVTDLHTHCYSPRFKSADGSKTLLLFGIDELLTYHYLVAEVFRVVPSRQLSYERFWSMSKQAQAEHIWKELFIKRPPLSEACRGVLTTLQRLGLDPNEKNLDGYRKWFAAQKPDAYIDKVMQLSGVDQITMTNPVFDDAEREMWERDKDLASDPRFKPVLRCDELITNWPWTARKLAGWGFDVREDLGGNTVNEVKRWLRFWLDQMKSEYLAMSLPPDWTYSAEGTRASDRVTRECLLPVLRERGLAWALMIGVRRQVNPALRDAGDASSRGDVQSVCNLCREFPENRFLVSMLSEENQHELCVAARKFGNLMIFGCWWFLNNPSLIERITRMRLEMLGTSFVAQHSDARILDQLIYKWDHNRRVIGDVLAAQFAELEGSGYAVSEEGVRRAVADLMRDNYRRFVK